MKKLLLITVLFLTVCNTKITAQGCVAIRSNGQTCSLSMPGHEEEAGAAPASHSAWMFSANHRYFRSFRHFRGTHEEEERVKNHTEVINWSNALDLGLTRVLNHRWSLSLNVPVISNVRSSLYEHDGASRHSTRSFGLGDIRMTAYRWLRDPARARKFNVQAGLGIKLPTGDYEVQDYFYRNDSTNVLGYVDQSIQLGDGGTGLTGELNAFFQLSRYASLYANGFYLLNPREHNGVSTGRGNPPSATAVRYGSAVMSVPDQYMARFGGSWQADRFTFSGGLRIEGVPSEDLAGGSLGFRRPGYVLAAEPVVVYRHRKMNFYASVPVALVRERPQSYADKRQTAATGVYRVGDAAFADYSINAGFSVQLH